MSFALAPASAARALAPFAPGPSQRPLAHAALVMLALIPLCLIALAADARTLNGVSVWAKPLKFQVSLILHLMTAAVLLHLVQPAARNGASMRAVALALAVCALLETAYITLQAARGRASHFNFDTPLDSALYSAMGVGAVLLIAGAAWIGVRILRRPADGVGPGLRLGAGLGLILGAAATFAVAGYLGNNGGPWVGGAPRDAASLPFVGWARDGGDLRVPHFFATHLMQALPLAGWAADRWAGRRAPALVWAAAGLGLALVAGTFLQALAGRPFL